MSQKPLSPPTTPNAPSVWFPTRPPRGYDALPCDGPEDYSEVELHPLKPASDIEAAPITDSHCNRTCRGSSTSRELLMFLGFLVVSTLVFSAFAWLAGVLILGITDPGAPTPSPYDPTAVTEFASVLKVLAVGSLVVALVPGAIVLLIFLRNGPLSLNSEMGDEVAARARAAMRGPALVALVVFALCVAVGAGLTTYALMST